MTSIAPLHLRDRLICLACALGMASGILLSWKLWIPRERTFPVVPLTPAMALPLSSTIVLIVVLLLCMALSYRLAFGIAATAAWLLLLGADVVRMQPWPYQYILIACIAGGRPRASRIVLGGVYLWAGIGKLNPFFFNETGPWLTQHLPYMTRSYWLLPGVEIVTGLALLLGGRWAGLLSRWLVLSISIGAMVCLTSWHWNTVVWPWQGINVILAWLSTARWRWPWPSVSSDAPPPPPARQRDAMRCAIGGLLAVGMPGLCYAGWWPAYFSWRLYDGRHGVTYPLQNESWTELNVPVPPDPWISKRLIPPPTPVMLQRWDLIDIGDDPPSVE